jgi:hypothetical protein
LEAPLGFYSVKLMAALLENWLVALSATLTVEMKAEKLVETKVH